MSDVPTVPETAPQVPNITPQPLPESWQIARVQGPQGQTMVVVVILSLNGQHVSFLDAAMAKQVAAQLQAQAGSGIVVAPGAALTQLPAIPENT